MHTVSGHQPAKLPALTLLCLGALLVMSWLNPTHYLPWTSFYSEVPAAFGALVLAVSVAWRQGVVGSRLPYSAFVLLAVATIPWLQWMAGQLSYGGDALLCSMYLVGTAACVSLGATNAVHDGDARLTEALAWAMLAGAMASTAIAMQQWFGQADWSEWVAEGLPGTRADANLGQANHMATLVIWAMLATAYLRTRGHFGEPAMGLTLGYLTIGLALSQSRTAGLALLVLTAWALTRQRALWAPLGLNLRRLWWLLPLYAGLLWAVLTLPETLRLLGAAPTAEDRMGVGGRPLMWSQMIEAIRLSPWSGHGWLQGLAAQSAAALEVPGREVASFSHNLVLDLFVWNGVVLGAVLASMLAWWYFRLGLLAHGAADAFRFGVLTTLAVHSMLEYPFAYAYFIVPAALLAGELETRGDGAFATPRLRRWAGWTLITCIAASAVGSVVIVRDYLLAEEDRRAVIMVMRRIGGTRPMPPLPDLWVLDQLRASSEGARVELKAGMTPMEMKSLARITERYPSVYFLRTKATALALNGQASAGLMELRRLRGIHGEAHLRASVAWIEETAADRQWPLETFVSQAKALP